MAKSWVAIFPDFCSFTDLHEICLACKYSDNFLFFNVELLRHNMRVGNHMETVRNDKAGAAQNRGRLARFLKCTNRDNCGFNLVDYVRKCPRVWGRSTKRKQQDSPNAAERGGDQQTLHAAILARDDSCHNCKMP